MTARGARPRKLVLRPDGRALSSVLATGILALVLAQQPRRLEALVLEGLSLDPNSFDAVLSETQPCLTGLDLRGYDLTREGRSVAGLGSLLTHVAPRLRRLEITDVKYWTRNFDPTLTTALQECSQITHLSLLCHEATWLMPPVTLPACLVHLDLGETWLRLAELQHVAQLQTLSYLQFGSVLLEAHEKPRSALPLQLPLPPRLEELNLRSTVGFIKLASLQLPPSLVRLGVERLDVDTPGVAEEVNDEQDAGLILAALRQLHGRLHPPGHLVLQHEQEDAPRLPGWETMLATIAPLGLRSLSLCSMGVTPEEVEHMLAALPGLEELSIGDDLTRGQLAALAAATALTSLEAVSLNGLQEPEDDRAGAAPPAAPLPPNLRELGFMGLVCPRDLAALELPPSLQWLSLDGICVYDCDMEGKGGALRPEAAEALLAACGVLVGRLDSAGPDDDPFQLSMNHAHPPASWGPAGWGRLWDAIGPLRLSKLSLHDLGGLTADDLCTLAERLTSLQVLEIGSPIPPTVLPELSRLPHLQSLTLWLSPDVPEYADWRNSACVQRALVRLCSEAAGLRKVTVRVLPGSGVQPNYLAVEGLLDAVKAAGRELVGMGRESGLLEAVK